MINNKKIFVVMPAYNAEKTLEKTYGELDRTIIDEVILTDDASRDNTVEVAKTLGIKHFIHEKNLGYGANQKTLYREALNMGADVVVMLHPDYQYDPKLAATMGAMVASEVYDCVLGSRILVESPLKGGMPIWKYISNRFLTLAQNLIVGKKLSEYHTGYRAFKREILEKLPLGENSNDFVFDNEMLSQIIYFNYRIGEISCPTKYFPEASSINFIRSLKYGIGCLNTALKVFIERKKWMKFRIFNPNGKKLN